MLFPKTKEKKKRKKHPPSILHNKNSRTCYLCVMLHDNWNEHRVLQEHHVFRGNANRIISEEYGLKVYLCPQHHTIGPEAVHNNDQIRRDMEHMAQIEFEKRYGHVKFIELFGQNYPSSAEIGDANGQEHKPVQDKG